ncbi:MULTISPECIES: hypothetical protein [unclassified Fibrobacter]|uniref:DUF7675 family protein n=1 Tax=unclassified Fibrobacter TaxID=2634177 RepID=UPI00091EE896|nr:MULTISPECIES: hypothetical protein [unclassified Fibrobacter]OWV01424.1 hypothetical protein B7993_15745 [Fibrobacter sp. UWH3]OWV04609.1 hypothetical protein B7992_15840 [Fibrobacter sp. UWH1]SHK83871.1 hypothetical protein SAMN05720765_105188 [Fibrobacter sp. UWH6]
MITVDKETRKFEFYKEKEDDKIWWVDYIDFLGNYAVSFDKKKILFLFGDYPKNFTKEEKDLFDKENPYWANFFRNKK